MADPMEQFEVKPVVEIAPVNVPGLGLVDLSITNSTVAMFVAATIVVLFFAMVTASPKVVPGRLQVVGEGNVEQGVERVAAQLGGDVCQRAPVETGVHRVHGVEDGERPPVGQSPERVVALGQVVQSLPLRGVGQDPLLLLAGKEHDVGPARDRIQHEAAGE